jgi:hypothetical protein
MTPVGGTDPQDGEGPREGGSPEGGHRTGGLRPAREALTPPPRTQEPAVSSPIPSAGDELSLSELRSLPTTERREFQDPQGVEWTATVVGRAVSGTPPDRGAPLLLVRFHRTVDSQAREVAPWPALEALVVAGELATLPEEKLQETLTRARPASNPRDEGYRRPPVQPISRR